MRVQTSVPVFIAWFSRFLAVAFLPLLSGFHAPSRSRFCLCCLVFTLPCSRVSAFTALAETRVRTSVPVFESLAETVTARARVDCIIHVALRSRF